MLSSPSPLSSLSPRVSALVFAGAAFVSAGTLPAQNGASTLAALLARADVVVQARTSGIPSGNAAVHRFRFHTELDLLGQAPAQFDLSEPAGHSCGRALAGLAQGSYLLFLARTGSGLRLVVSGARSKVPADLIPNLQPASDSGSGQGAGALITRSQVSLASARPFISTLQARVCRHGARGHHEALSHLPLRQRAMAEWDPPATSTNERSDLHADVHRSVRRETPRLYDVPAIERGQEQLPGRDR